jgi:hypothetical protein
MADQFVRIYLDQRRKLRYKHKDLRDVCAESGKSLGELMHDPFGGWPYLLRFGLRWQDLTVTLDKASEFIDLWLDEPDPEDKNQTPRTMDQLGLRLLDALNASGFVKIQAEMPLEARVELAEGNARPEAAKVTLTEA